MPAMLVPCLVIMPVTGIMEMMFGADLGNKGETHFKCTMGL